VINAAVIALRYHSPHTPRAFRIPYSIGRLPLIPVAGIIFCISLLAVQDPVVLTIGVVLTGLGVVLMVVTGHYASKSP
jgi:APA family basic amino acid/polyamine antiporter